MSWKRAERSRRGIASWSISARLSALFAAGSLAVLVSTGLLLYAFFARGIFEDEARSLVDEVDEVRAVLQKDPELSTADGVDARRRYEILRGADYVLRVSDEHGRIVFETPGLTEALPPHVFPSTDSKAANQPVVLRLRKRDGMTYVVATAITDIGSGASERRIVQVAYDASHEEALLRNYRDETLAAILLGTLACVLLGAVVARKGLQPLAEITEATRGITATHLDQRIGQRPWPKELVALASAFDAMLARLELSVARLSQFSADLAHELRTPLNNLIGEAEVWLSRRRTEDEYRAIIESSLEECTRLSRLIEELLFLARVENDRLRIEKVELEARDVAEDVKSLYEALAEERGIELSCEGRASVKASPMLLRRALINLVSNGVKDTAAGGRVVIAAQRVGDGAEIAVSDDGDGIPEEHLPRIFDRFYRVDSARARDPGGSGLGLAIVKSILDLHGGRVEIESKVGQGTTVTLRLPDA